MCIMASSGDGLGESSVSASTSERDEITEAAATPSSPDAVPGVVLALAHAQPRPILWPGPPLSKSRFPDFVIIYFLLLPFTCELENSTPSGLR